MSRYTENGRLRFSRYAGVAPSAALNEGLIGIKPQIWPNIPLRHMFAILKFDPGWDRRMMYGHTRIRVAADAADGLLKRIGGRYDAAAKCGLKWRPSVKSRQGKAAVKYEYGGDAAALVSAARDLCRRLGYGDVSGCFAPADGGVSVSGADAAQMKKAYTFLDWLAASD